MQIKSKLTLGSLALSLIPLLIMGFYFFGLSQRSLEQTSLQSLQALASLQESRIQTLLKEYVDQARSISGHDMVIDLLRSSHEDSIVFDKFMSLVKSFFPHLTAFSLTDTSGSIILSSDADLLGSNEYKSLLADSQTKHNRLESFSDVTGENQSLRFAQSIYDNGVFLGYAVVYFDIQPFLDMTADYSGLGETGELELGQRISDQSVIAISRLRFDPDAGVSRILSLEEDQYPIVQAVQGVEQIFSKGVIDYRQEPIFAVSRYIEELDWGMVVKIDQSEVLDVIRRLKLIFFVSILGFSLLVFMGSKFIALSFESDIQAYRRSSHKK